MCTVRRRGKVLRNWWGKLLRTDKMKELGFPASSYRAAILEVAASTATDEDIFGRENAWKEKMGTRVKGLNRN